MIAGGGPIMAGDKESTALHTPAMLDLLEWMNAKQQATLASGGGILHQLVKEHFNIVLRKLFAKLDIDSAEMLSVLQSSKSVISGSFALAVLNYPSVLNPGDLDVYVAARLEDVRTLVKGLRSMGMARVSSHKGREKKYWGYGIMKVWNFQYAGERKLQVIISKSSALAPIFHFHSTAVMNFVSWNTVFCAYPELTFEHCNLVNLAAADERKGKGRERRSEAIRKYERRGYEAATNSRFWEEHRNHRCGEDWSCGRTIRNVGDEGCFWFSFQGVRSELKESRLQWVLEAENAKGGCADLRTAEDEDMERRK
ncbi:hypothetical protein H0H93_003967 [Arthromyces matolae]|nr:hypothetical protein H0H93_003967 [Arthromyces matolae]